MKQITINTYKFEELSKEAKKRAVERNSEINDYDWQTDELVYFAEQVKEKLDLDIEPKEVEFDTYRPHIALPSRSVERAMSRKYTTILSIDLPDKFGLYTSCLGGGMTSSLKGGEFKKEAIELEEEHRGSEDIEREVELVSNEQIKEKIMEDLAKLQNMMKECFKSLYDQYNYLNSFEGISESLIANEYDFEEDGERV